MSEIRARSLDHVALWVEERDVLADTVERVACRWCAAVDSVVLVPRPGTGERSTAGPSAVEAAADPA